MANEHNKSDYHADTEHHDAHGSHDIKQYIYVFLALCVLTGASFFTYSDLWPFHDQPEIGWTFMMGVSCTKAMLVIMFFMHLKYEASWKYVLTIPASVMSVFLVIALIPDIKWRYETVVGGRTVSEERLRFMATEPLYPRHPVSEEHGSDHGDLDHADPDDHDHDKPAEDATPKDATPAEKPETPAETGTEATPSNP